MSSYCEKKAVKIPFVFSAIFVADTKIVFVYNLLAPLKNISISVLNKLKSSNLWCAIGHCNLFS